MASHPSRCGRATKPDWLKVRLAHTAKYAEVASLVDRYGLHTICSSGRCPNISECWSSATATFLIAGGICTRSCRFCATPSGRPLSLDADEPSNIARSVRLMELEHAVITSVDRDDLPDGGAEHWAAVVGAVRRECSGVTVEALVPDFGGRVELLDVIVGMGADVVGHNMETVRRLTPSVRSVATYDCSLGVLRYFSSRGCDTKSSLMLGLGESEGEVVETMQDLYDAGVRRLTLGQYLQPTVKHLEVVEYVEPSKFEWYKTEAERIGFTHVVSGPLVRSSYHAKL